MLLRTASRSLDDWTEEAAISTRHPAGSVGRPVLLIQGEPIGPIQANWEGFRILDATAAELELLRRGDYRLEQDVPGCQDRTRNPS